MFKSIFSGVTGGDFHETPLQPMSEPICATETRFCLSHPVTLELREKYFSFSGDDFKISCAATGQPYFQCQGKAFSLREKKVLQDNFGQPVANIKEKMFSFTDKFQIYAGDGSDRKICDCNASLNFVKAKLTMDFNDVAALGKMRRVVLKGDWRDKRCIIYLGEPKHGGIPIAKLFRPLTMRSHFLGKDVYHLEVAPGVDIALMVMMCITLDEHARD